MSLIEFRKYSERPSDLPALIAISPAAITSVERAPGWADFSATIVYQDGGVPVDTGDGTLLSLARIAVVDSYESVMKAIETEAV